jgi:hypothetical protein
MLKEILENWKPKLNPGCPQAIPSGDILTSVDYPLVISTAANSVQLGRVQCKFAEVVEPIVTENCI